MEALTAQSRLDCCCDATGYRLSANPGGTAMKPQIRSVLGTFANSVICTSAGIIVGMWMEHGRAPPNIDVPCSDSPLACAKRTAANRCGGPGRYRLVDEHKSKFVFICVTAETI